MNLMRIFVIFLLVFFSQSLTAQRAGYWQQEVDYKMDIVMDAAKHQFSGKQEIIYKNNATEDLNKVFFHLYFNAFQPGSMMDVRSRTIDDPDGRVRDRIFKLSEDEIGYQHIKSVKVNGDQLAFNVEGTIMQVNLLEPIKPGKKAKFELEFEGQVPLQIRRSGRDNAEGIEFSMTQWYPKMAEFDHEGWHSNPYIGREFHGVWGSFDVKITMDSSYVIAATGALQNPEQIGHGYLEPGKKLKRKEGDKLTWHFKAKKVHDFAWAADPDYKHITAQVPDGPLLRFFYQPGEKTTENWEKLPEKAVKVFEIMNKTFGKYPFERYSIVQGGDGGMEYPQLTLITGNRNFNSLVGVMVHESIHSWYQGVLATNESLYPWMDEGFTSYASSYVSARLDEEAPDSNPFSGSYRGYFRLIQSGRDEPMTVHADHYNTNFAYSVNAYSKGAITLHQLGYVIGDDAFFAGMKMYFNEWKFKHPTVTDFKRVMERVSQMELDWYFEHWINATNTIDYAIGDVVSDGTTTKVTLKRIGKMPMPVDVLVSKTDGATHMFNIPLRVMRGAKPDSEKYDLYSIEEDWPWTYPAYILELPIGFKEIESIIIDPLERTADVDRDNNVFPRDDSKAFNPNK